MTWSRAAVTDRPSTTHNITIPTSEAPYYALTVGPLAGGRRLLSDDEAMLDRAAILIARRIDALRLTSERYERVLLEREMQTLATEAELRALRAQINPHFLFNALTTIGYLIQHAPPRALDTLMRLTTLLRGVLRSEGEFTTLGHERDLLECYLDIECERFEERLQVDIDIPADLSTAPIPSLIVQPLVENSLGHGMGSRIDGITISIRATRDGSNLVISVEDDGIGFPPGYRERTGIGNLRERLRTLHGDRASLDLGVPGPGSRVAVRLPLERADRAGADR